MMVVFCNWNHITIDFVQWTLFTHNTLLTVFIFLKWFLFFFLCGVWNVDIYVCGYCQFCWWVDQNWSHFRTYFNPCAQNNFCRNYFPVFKRLGNIYLRWFRERRTVSNKKNTLPDLKLVFFSRISLEPLEL